MTADAVALITMFDIQAMFRTEISFCDSFTNREDTQYGRLYFNPLNLLSHDSNHAHVMKNVQHPRDALDIGKPRAGGKQPEKG